MPGGGEAGGGPGNGAGACVGFAAGTGATARCTGGDAGVDPDPRATRGAVPGGGLVSGAPIGERRRAGVGLRGEGR